MAQTKKKRRTKHRGTQAGTIDRRGSTRRPQSRQQLRHQASQRRQAARVARASAPPTWRSAGIKGGIAAAMFFAFLLIMGRPPVSSAAIAILMVGLYVPMGYGMDSFIYKRQQQRLAREAERADPDGA